MTKQSYPIGFYVYRLIDPRNGLPFYVGKGQRNRAWQHERAVIADQPTGNARKDRAIRAILDAGIHVEVQIVATYPLESDALEHEWRLVDATPTLTNVMPGGIGPAATPAQIERRQRAREMRLRTLRAEERETSRQKFIEHRRASFSALAQTEQSRAEIDDWIDGLKATGESLRHHRRHRSRKASKTALATFRATKPA